MINEMEFREVVRFLEETPESIRQLTTGLRNGEACWKPAPDAFSALEQVCHLRDLEREGYALRIDKLLKENQPSLPDFDGGRIAKERDYNSQDFESALEDFARARAENVRLMKTLSMDELHRSGVLAGVGEITLMKLFLLMREHDLSHRQELADLRQAKKMAEVNQGKGAKPLR